MFFDKLPRGLRDTIYDFVFPQQYWSMDEDVSRITDLDLLGSMSDLSGFYFPLAPESGILAVNQQMREEALRWAYRSTSFELDGIDDVVKLLLGISEIGRDNVRSLAFGWQSSSESDFERHEAPGKVTVEGTVIKDLFLTLPVIHVDTCMQLLKQCGRLTHLRLNFEKELIDNLEPRAFKATAGIRKLSSLRGLGKTNTVHTRREAWYQQEGGSTNFNPWVKWKAPVANLTDNDEENAHRTRTNQSDNQVQTSVELDRRSQDDYAAPPHSSSMPIQGKKGAFPPQNGHLEFPAETEKSQESGTTTSNTIVPEDEPVILPAKSEEEDRGNASLVASLENSTRRGHKRRNWNQRLRDDQSRQSRSSLLWAS
ncbi:MAG: hypothetical protein L6R42_000108 [Xanthoria sp. 1 TBL-2021]|nr:MAG: hypothetical protein L6R42_000108 [Xanthoria sp. 1 TBL-2021]